MQTYAAATREKNQSQNRLFALRLSRPPVLHNPCKTLKGLFQNRLGRSRRAALLSEMYTYMLNNPFDHAAIKAHLSP